MGLGNAALWFIPTRNQCNPTRTQPGPSPSPFILPPFPAPPAADLRLCSVLAPGPRAATQRPREARRVYFRRHHDPQACEKQAARALPAWLRDVLSLSKAFPAKRCKLRGCSEPTALLPSLARCPYWGGEVGMGGAGAGSPPPACPLPIQRCILFASIPRCRVPEHPRS